MTETSNVRVYPQRSKRHNPSPAADNGVVSEKDIAACDEIKTDEPQILTA
jgi:hypothetical protein